MYVLLQNQMSLKERKQLNAGKEGIDIRDDGFEFIQPVLLIRVGLLSGNKRGPAALAGNIMRSSPQQDDSSTAGT